MKIVKKLKDNAFVVLVVLAYVALFALRPASGVAAVKNSGYYLKEMLMIMPVVFVLTGLLDTWVPREVITRYLGEASGVKGVFFSFVLGSISAGPIYAAFPMCVTLHKKGASVRSLVIILSAWAVIKVPMLLAETKFLGPKFMAIRWVLTVIAILVFSRIIGRVVKDGDLPVEGKTPPAFGPRVDTDACIGCGLCARSYPEVFSMEGKKARAELKGLPDRQKMMATVKACPVNAIITPHKIEK